MSDPTNPCLRCGACCAYCRVSFHSSQLESLGGRVPDALADEESAATRRMRGTDHAQPRCVALIGRIGERVCCAIYESRPDPCMEFAPHGQYGIHNVACNLARRRHGLPPLSDPPGLSCGGVTAKR